MVLFKTTALETVTGAVVATSALVLAAWWMRRHRPSDEELELARRDVLTQTGRLVDGMLLDVCEFDLQGSKRTLLVYNYRISGVDYECSQDITTMESFIDPAEVRAGFPCTVRYHQRSPLNSIVVAEKWSGLRDRLASFPQLKARHG